MEATAGAEDVRGRDLEDAGDDRGAQQHFEKALALARTSAPFFLVDDLGSTLRVLCRDAATPAPNCPR